MKLNSYMCNVQTAVTVFDLLDYYESCERLNISYNKNLGIRGWQACARFIKKVCIVMTVAILSTSIKPQILLYLLPSTVQILQVSIAVTYRPTEIYENNVLSCDS